MFISSGASSSQLSALRVAKLVLISAVAAAALSACATVKPEAGAKGDPLSYDWVLEHGDQFQQGELCVRFFRGDLGVERDYDKAYALCYKSAQKCVSVAAATLSLMYREGLGVKTDLKAALGWNYLNRARGEAATSALADQIRLENVVSDAERVEALLFACEWQEKYCFNEDDEIPDCYELLKSRK